MGSIDWTDSAEKISYLVRGMNPWPSAFSKLNGKMLKIWTVKALDEQAGGEPGTVEYVTKDSIVVNTGEGLLEITELQLEGKKRMRVKDFLLGYSIASGDKLG